MFISIFTSIFEMLNIIANITVDTSHVVLL